MMLAVFVFCGAILGSGVHGGNNWTPTEHSDQDWEKYMKTFPTLGPLPTFGPMETLRPIEPHKEQHMPDMGMGSGGIASYFKSQKCDLSKLEKCAMKKVKESKIDYNWFDTSNLLKGIDKETVLKLCKASRLVEPCLGSNMVVCAGPMANWYDIYLAGVLAVRDYVCGEGLDKFVQSIPCLGNMVMQIQGGNAGLFSDPKAANCLMQVMQEKDVQEMMFETGTQAAIPNGLKNKPKIWKKLCDFTDETTDCMHLGVEKVCGKDTADFFVKVPKIMMSAASKASGSGECDSGLKPWAWALIGVGCAAIVIIVAISVVMVIRKRRDGFQYKRESLIKDSSNI